VRYKDAAQLRVHRRAAAAMNACKVNGAAPSPVAPRRKWDQHLQLGVILRIPGTAASSTTAAMLRGGPEAESSGYAIAGCPAATDADDGQPDVRGSPRTPAGSHRSPSHIPRGRRPDRVTAAIPLALYGEPELLLGSSASSGPPMCRGLNYGVPLSDSIAAPRVPHTVRSRSTATCDPSTADHCNCRAKGYRPSARAE